MPGHLSAACGLTTLNATHLRAGQSRCSSSFRELGISIVLSARPSTREVLLAWWRSLLGRRPLGLGEDVGRVAGAAPRAQQLGGLHRHDCNCHRRAVAIRWLRWNIGATSFRGWCIAAIWCSTFQWLHVVLLVAAGRPWAPAAYISSWSNWSSGSCLEACPRWCSDNLNTAVRLLVLAWHVAVVQHRHGERSETALLGLPAACGSA